MSIKAKINGEWVVQTSGGNSVVGNVVGSVLYNNKQNLDESEQKQARDNIGAADAKVVDDIVAQKSQVQIVTWEDDD